MKIIFDCEFDAHGLPRDFIYIDTTDPIVQKTLDDINKGKVDPVQAGYANETKLPGVPSGTSRWKAILTEAAKPNAPQEIKALGLKDIAVATVPVQAQAG